MKWELTGKRSLAWLAAFTICLSAFGAVLPALHAAEEETPIYLDTNYTFEERAADLVSRMTLEEKASQTVNEAAAIPRLGVAQYNYWSEALHGVARSGWATSFPTGYSIAQTWNRELVQEMMSISSDEARAYNNQTGKGLSYWSPTINMSRDPRWGRAEETYGEDPYLTTQIGASFVKGLEGTNEETKYLKTAATVKHYAANNSEFNRHNGSSDMDDRTLREYYTRPFKGVVQEAGVHSAMTAYNSVNKVPSPANTYLLETLLRCTFGFTGFVVSDCGAIADVHGSGSHHYQPEGWDKPVDATGATAISMIAGTDIECGSIYKNNVQKAIQQGFMTEHDLDIALVRAFTFRMQTGEFDDASIVPYRDTTNPDYAWTTKYGKDGSNPEGGPLVTSSERAVSTALQAAEEGVAMLKNDPAKDETQPLLPLDATKDTNIVLVGEGELANSLVLGDYSGTPLEANRSKPVDGVRSVLTSLNPNAKLTYINTSSSSVNAYFGNFTNIILTNKSGKETTLVPRDVKGHSGCDIQNNNGNIGNVYNGAWVKYENVDITDIAKIGVMASGKPGDAIGGTIYLHLDSLEGPIFATVDVNERTTGWTDYKLFENTVNEAGFSGKRTVYAVCNTGVVYEGFKAADQKTIRNADAVIAYVGTRQSDSRENNDRQTLALPRFQSDMVEEVVSLNPRTVAYISSVAQLDIEAFRDEVPSILWCTYNGQAQGLAAGNLLFGKANPSGKLTFTWYTDEDELPDIADYNIYTTDTSLGRTYQYFSGQVSYPFGHGLSYSNFEYSNMRIEGLSSGEGYQMGDVNGDSNISAQDALMALQAATKKIELTADQATRADVDNVDGVTANDALMILQAATKKITLPMVEGGDNTITPDDTLTVTVDVTNDSEVDGAEVVQAYVVPPPADKVNRPAKQLKGFEKVTIAAGETETVTIELPVADWYFWDEEAGKNIYDQGEWTIEIGSSSGDIREEATVALAGELTPVLTTFTASPSGHVLDLSIETLSTEVSAAMSDDSFYDLSKAEVTFTSNRPEVATVDPDGTVHSVGPGVATITASITIDDVTKTSSFPVAVKNELSVTELTVNGRAVENFSPATYEYEVVLAPGATTAVVAVPGSNEGITIVQPTEIPGTATVTTTSGNTTLTYILNIRPYHPPAGTDFTALDALADDWSIYSNEQKIGETASNWKLTESGLTITTEAGDLYQNHNDAKNIFLQKADGDWVSEIKFTMSSAFTGGYQQVGFLVFQDEDNYLKFSLEQGNSVKVVQELNQSTKEMQTAGNYSPGLTQYYCIAKTGNVYTFLYSKDGGATYTQAAQVTNDLKNPSLGLSAVNSFNGTPAPIDVSFEYLHVWTMDDCTCTLDEITLTDTIALQNAVTGVALNADTTVGGNCPVPGHAQAEPAYTYALASGGVNTANATLDGNTLKATVAGEVDVRVTATLQNGRSKSSDIRVTVGNTDPDLVGWLFYDPVNSRNSHNMVVKYQPYSPLDLSEYTGRTLYLEFQVMAESTHTDPEPVNDDWVKYVVNGDVKLNGTGILSLGYQNDPAKSAFNKAAEWKTLRVALPESALQEGISKLEFNVYNDTGTKYINDPNYVSNGIEWNNNTGVSFSIRQVKITVQ